MITFFLSLIGFYFLDILVSFWMFLFLLFSMVFFRGVDFYYDGVLFLDYFGVSMVFLSVFLLMRLLFVEKYLKGLNVFLFLLVILIGCFGVDNYIYFYILFEIVFIFMFFYVLEFRGSPWRFQASFYMFFYTLVFSFPFLLFLIYLYVYRHGSNFFFFFEYEFSFLCYLVFMVFMIKLPLYGVHLWLPKAHVEATVRGSIVLAGVFLKIGGYGFYRFFPLVMKFFSVGRFFFNYIFYVRIFGGLLLSIVCLRQKDLKMLIAYSSVVHIRVLMTGLLSYVNLGLYGSLVIIFSHGFISPIIFYLITLLYDKFGSRRLMLLKGLSLINPLFVLLWFFSCFINLRVPPFLSFVGEIFVFRSLGMFLSVNLIFLIFLIFFVGTYCLFIYVGVVHGRGVVNLDLNICFKFVYLCLFLLSYMVSFIFFCVF